MPLFDLIELPFCKVIRIEPWNAEAHRYFIAYESRNDFTQILGLPVIEEFSTFSSPIFFAAAPILGKIYNAGLTLAHHRSPDMDIDTGWPPLCIGLDQPEPELPSGWEAQLLNAIESNGAAIEGTDIAGYRMARLDLSKTVSIFATDAPLTPLQLKRLCRSKSSAALVVAFSVGNRLVRQQNGATNEIRAVSESILNKLREFAAGPEL